MPIRKESKNPCKKCNGFGVLKPILSSWQKYALPYNHPATRDKECESCKGTGKAK